MSGTGADELAPTWGKRLNGVDGIRGIAATSVMLGHTVIMLMLPTFTAPLVGPITGLLLRGVALFMVLSGFLLYRPFAVAIIDRAPQPSTRNFLRNRVLRIAPAYLVIFVIACLIVGVAVIDTNGSLDEWSIGRMSDPLLLFTNIFLVQGWFPGGVFTGLSVSWSLVPEVCFYLMLPGLGALGSILAKRRSPAVAVLIPATLLLVCGMAYRVVSWSSTANASGTTDDGSSTWTDVVSTSILAQGDLFAMGMIAGVAVVYLDRLGARGLGRLRRTAWIFLWLGVLGTVGAGEAERSTPFVGIACAAALVLLRMPRPGRLVRATLSFLETRVLRAVGVWSYSVYLWHFPVILFLRAHVDRAMFSTMYGLLLSIILVAAVTYTLSYVTYTLVEAPAMRRKRRMVAPTQI